MKASAGCDRARVAPDCTSVWAQHTDSSAGSREALASALKAQGIPTAIYYPRSLHQQTAYRSFPVAASGLAVSERLSPVISLPYASLSR
jgi:dTDP-4-amino-4,6-dideoxygalactose transaminase